MHWNLWMGLAVAFTLCLCISSVYAETDEENTAKEFVNSVKDIANIYLDESLTAVKRGQELWPYYSKYLEAKETGYLWEEFLKAYPDFDGEYDAITENIKQLKTLTIWKITRGDFQSDEFSGVRTMLNTWSSMIVDAE